MCRFREQICRLEFTGIRYKKSNILSQAKKKMILTLMDDKKYFISKNTEFNKYNNNLVQLRKMILSLQFFAHVETLITKLCKLHR